MVTKSPKALRNRQQRIQNSINLYPRVNIRKLDENVVRAYQRRQAGISCNFNSNREGRQCFFTSEIDLERSPFSTECSGPCQCQYCSPYREMKELRQYGDAVQDQENVGPKYQPYLCDVVQETAEPLARGARQAPLRPATEKRDAETQTAAYAYRFTCDVCKSQFNNLHFYEQHVLVHSSKLLECPFCNATFAGEKQLQPHVLLHLSKNFFECAYCSCVFASKKHLVQHIASHDKRHFECGQCPAMFVSEEGLRDHRQSHVSSGKLIHVFRLAKAAQDRKEAACPRSTSIVKQANVSGFYKCDVCRLRFTYERSLQRHKAIHNRTGAKYLHFCSSCNARFVSNNHLVGHQRHAHKQ